MYFMEASLPQSAFLWHAGNGALLPGRLFSPMGNCIGDDVQVPIIVSDYIICMSSYNNHWDCKFMHNGL